MKNSFVLYSALCIAVASPASGQTSPDTVRLRDVIVTATRLPTRLADVPGSVTLLRGEDLIMRGIRTVADALRHVPGAAVMQSGGPGGITSVFMRGGESDYVQVLVDGVQVNMPGGAYNWAHLRTEDIDRIEIVRGPVSVLYGSDAVAGVVHIFTRSGGPRRMSVGANGMRGDRPADFDGSADAHAFDVALTGSAANRLHYGFTAVRAGSSGLYENNSDYDNTSISGRLHFTGQHGDAALSLRSGSNEYHYPTSGSGAITDPNQFATGDTRTLGLDAGFSLTRALELRVLGALHDSDSRTDDPSDPGTADDGVFWSTANQLRQSVDVRANATLPRGFIATVGAEREWQDDQSAYESTSQFGTFTDETDEARASTGVYAQLHSAALRSFSLTLGGRVDDNNRFGRFTTGRVAAAWRGFESIRVHTALGTAFKEPTFFENFAVGFTRGNPALEPEESRSWEIGAQYDTRGGALSLSGTWFDQRFENLIQYTAVTAENAPNYSNVGAASAHGLELTVQTAASRVTLQGTYTFTRTRTLEEGFGEDPAFESGASLLRRPEHMGSASVNVRLTPSLQMLLGARGIGRREDLDFTDPVNYMGTRTTLPAYAALDLGLDYGAIRYGAAEVSLSAQLRNATDTRYEEIYNFPAARRSLQLGARVAFGM